MDPIKLLDLQREFSNLQTKLAVDKYETTLRIKALETGNQDIIQFVNKIIAEDR